MAQSTDSKIQLEDSWKSKLENEFDLEYMKVLRGFLQQEKVQQRKVVYPPGKEIFAALNTTPFSQVKVVILGQDPYHGPGQAHGLCFSVRPGVPLPPSLQNIFKELAQDLGVTNGEHGCLTAWAEQGVLLLNSVLTVVQGKAGSHQGKGWEVFTDAVIQSINNERSGVVFMLWGSYAQKKGQIIDRKKHLVLQSPHPSPLSAHRGFFGNQHFSQANDYLIAQGLEPIDWQLPSLSELEIS
jgi:uracil-DNA glycosylase